MLNKKVDNDWDKFIEREQNATNGQKSTVNKVFRNGRFVEVSENSKNGDK